MQIIDLPVAIKPVPLLTLSLLVLLLLSGYETVVEAEEIRPVRAITVAYKMREDVQVLPGLVTAHRYVNASFKISGRLTQRYVSVGSTVVAGQLLARVNDDIEKNTFTAADAEQTAAKAALEQAESVEKRAALLFKTRAVSQNEYEEASRQLKSARAMVQASEAKLRSAREQLGYTALYAPTAGIVTDTFAEPGEMAAAGHPVLRLADNRTLDTLFDMPADILIKGLTPGRTIQVCLDEGRNECTEATVYEIAPDTDPTTRTYLTKARIDQPLKQMLLGATVFGHISLASAETIQIPAAALTASADKAAVWVVSSQDSTVELRPIETAGYTTDGVLVSDGLQPGEMVVTAGVQALHQGQKVAILVEGHEKH
ncbi:efflux RND transporter periplasmic adaptor subunit [Desulfopila sp. IMCC35006]|uniref:efflux RND transporter periplasmic adaptor subunit n=1 Tax=Desulfopila sp. IMCC35006 TaxID=2569542 RepID=UPI0010ABE7CC|nr:efflux RND transporter periplasmic adaptor subunit [Desulfopila sp. IMCC35006]TKB26589.1 efflux RND transporter periplasmic adaptor subunit [Desulfopila sp. IMCC35006]